MTPTPFLALYELSQLEILSEPAVRQDRSTKLWRSLAYLRTVRLMPILTRQELYEFI